MTFSWGRFCGQTNDLGRIVCALPVPSHCPQISITPTSGKTRSNLRSNHQLCSYKNN